MYRSEALSQFSKHTPRILRRQLILQLAEQYLGAASDADESEIVCRPSLQRFHGALLFVDISGFTALSLRLNVEDLKNHINEYFQKMLDIVDKYEGDVVKFAGDALFIIWENYHPPTSDKTFEESAKRCLERAVECGKEINESCGNHKVVITPAKPTRPSTTSGSKSEGPSTPRGHSNSFDESEPTGRIPNTIQGTKLAPLPHVNSGIATGESGSPKNSANEEECAYLNVHSGVSMGLMAGVDIGADNRWEYFLIGEPLSKVAQAESLAHSGDIIVCPESHALLHQEFSPSVARVLNIIVSNVREKFHHPEESLLPCGCTALKGGYCRIAAPKDNSFVEKRKAKQRNTRRSSIEDAIVSSAIRHDIDSVYTAFEGQFMKEFLKRLHPGDSSKEFQLSAAKVQESFTKWAHGCLTDDVARHVHQVMRSEYSFSNISRYGAYENAIEEQRASYAMNQHIQAQAGNPLLHGELSLSMSTSPPDDHADSLSVNLKPVRVPSAGGSRRNSRKDDEVSINSRKTSGSSEDSGKSPDDMMDSPLIGEDLISEESSEVFSGTHTPQGLLSKNNSARMTITAQNSNLKDGQSPRSTIVSKRGGNNLLKAAFGTSPVLPSKNVMSVEMRTVTVMFVKINMPKTDLLVDHSKGMKMGGTYRFLGRTVNESVADLLLVNRFQKCITALSEAFMTYGGQMRQFIVDDKGTVCIGTFGLRGSVSDDNAAAALDTAHMIVTKLQALGLESSIGVTVGKAYCGLVGSASRHEYAVMGPSTNLSARLMCKAPRCGIICDIETRKRDRTHDFKPLSDIIAKGYSAPVGTFKPLFQGDEEHLMITTTLSVTNDSLPSTIHMLKTQTTAEPGELVPTGATKTQGKKVLFLMTGKLTFRLGGKNDSKLELNGRSEEISGIISFAFSSLLIEDASEQLPVAPIATPKASNSNLAGLAAAAGAAGAGLTVGGGGGGGLGGASKHIFDHTHPTRCVGIVGTNGIGKTCLVTALTEQLAVVIKKTAGCNIQIFKSRSDSYSLNLPFIAWKPIMLDIIIRIFRNRKSNPQRRRSFAVGVASSSNEIIDAINYVTDLLPEEVRSLKPLFGYLSYCALNTEALEELKLTNQEKLMKSVDLLKAVLQLYTTSTKNLVYILMEDVYLFDRSSLRLLIDVFKSNTGVVILFTGRSMVAAASSANTKASDDMSMDTAGASSPMGPMQSLLTALSGKDRFLELELKNLSKEATSALVKAALMSFDYPDVELDHNLYDKVYQITAGNPFYAYEVAKSLSENQDVTLPSEISSLHVVRVEEVICYRFDQLKNSAQTLLKIASVACANGGAFTLNMLTHIDDGKLILEHTSNSFTMDEGFAIEDEMTENDHLMIYASILHSILTTESFIRIVKKGSTKSTISSSGASEDEADFSVEALLTKNYCFEFSVSLELSTIYNLLLDDQKQALHEELGEYFQDLRESASAKVVGGDGNAPTVITAHQYKREAFHWENACMWSHAMVCYYKAFELEFDVLERADHLSMAYSMFCNMQDQHIDPSAVDTRGISLANMQGLFENTFLPNDRGQVDLSQTPVMTLEKVYQLFEGDSDLLGAGLNVMVQVALRHMRRGEDWQMNEVMLEDAVQMMLLTKHGYLIDSKYSVMLNQVLRKNNKKDVGEVGEGGGGGVQDMDFSLKNFWSVCFQVLSAYLLNFEMSTVGVESEEAQKAAYVGTLYLELVRQRKDTVHIIQSLIVNALLEAKAWNLAQCLAYVEELKTLFVFEKHSKFLIVTYGADLSSYMLSVVSQFVAIAVDKHAADPINMHCTKFMCGLTHHAPSLMNSIFNTISALAYNREFTEAFELLSGFNVALKTTRIHPKEAVPAVILHLYSEWLLLASNHKPHAGSVEVRQIEESLGQAERLLVSNHNLRHRHNLQLVLADVYILKMEADEHLTKNVEDCMRHLQELLRVKTVVPLDVFIKARAARLAVDALKKATELEGAMSSGSGDDGGSSSGSGDGSLSPHSTHIKKCFTVTDLTDLRSEAHTQNYQSFSKDLDILHDLLLG